MEFLKKITIITFCLISTATFAAQQNFNNAKTHLVKIYTSNPEQTTFYCGCEFSFNGKSGVVDFSKCGYAPRKNQARILYRV